MSVAQDLTGQRFGSLTVVERAPNRITRGGASIVFWDCVCDCGRRKPVRGSYLRAGRTSTCGCGRKPSGAAEQPPAAPLLDEATLDRLTEQFCSVLRSDPEELIALAEHASEVAKDAEHLARRMKFRWDQGWSCGDIGTEFHVSAIAVAHYLKKIGVITKHDRRSV